MRSSEEELDLQEKKAEALIGRALDEGADADFQFVRNRMYFAREYEIPHVYSIAIAHLEESISAAMREKARRSSRRSFVVKFKNLLGIG